MYFEYKEKKENKAEEKEVIKAKNFSKLMMDTKQAQEAP